MKKLLWIGGGTVGFVLLLLLAIWTNPYWTHGSKVVTVTGVSTKRVVEKGQYRDIYLVYTDDETYKNVDSPAYLKFNSSDVQGKLIVTGRFKIDYYGFRVPVLSMYKNIVKVEKVQ